MIDQILNDIRVELKENAPSLTSEKRARIYKIINSQNQNFEYYGLTVAQIEGVAKSIFKKYESITTFNESIEIFKSLISSDIHDEQFAGVFFLNQFKKEFDETTINLFQEQLKQFCSTWALCDSTCIRVIGPFLAKNDQLAKRTIETWMESENLWIQRAAMVILLKIILVKKNFDEAYVFNLVEKMLISAEEYIQRGVGWLLKICSQYKPDIIFNYLQQHKQELPRLVLRYASEKLSKEQRTTILGKT